MGISCGLLDAGQAWTLVLSGFGKGTGGLGWGLELGLGMSGWDGMEGGMMKCTRDGDGQTQGGGGFNGGGLIDNRFYNVLYCTVTKYR